MSTRKDFEMVAAVLAERVALIGNTGLSPYEVVARTDEIRRVADRFAVLFGHQNPRFNRNRFLDACGLDDDAMAANDVRRRA
jgi:hypothetical protein